MDTDITWTDLQRVEKTNQSQALTSCNKNKTKNKTAKRTENTDRTGFSMMGVVPDFILLPWKRDTGGYRCTDVHTYCTCTPSHIRESAPKVEREARGGGCGQSDISSWVLATVWKCHIIQAETSIKVRKSFLTVDSEGIITWLHHPLCIWFSFVSASFCLLFLYRYVQLPQNV